MELDIRFCRRPDGVRLAYALEGDGPPILVVFPWSHIESDFGGLRHFIEGLAAHHTVVRFDRHGTGLSDRERDDFSLGTDVLDVEALVEHLGLATLAIFGVGPGAAVAVAYAARHPDRVTDLILCRTYLRGESLAPPAVQAMLLETIEAHWGMGSRTMAALMAPNDDADVVAAVARWNRESVSAQTAARIVRASHEHDMTALAPSIRCRALIIQGKSDPFAPFAAGRELASSIPQARFVAIEEYPSFPTIAKHIAEFFGDPNPQTPSKAPVTVLVTDRASSTELTHRMGEEESQELQREHDRIVREALRSHGGTEIKHLGDGIMATFGPPSAAITCAIVLQQAFAEREDIHVRVGLAAGEVVAENDDIFGSTVQLANRVCARARPGQILVSEAVRQLAGVRGFKFGEARSVTLKGFPERVRLYEVSWIKNV